MNVILIGYRGTGKSTVARLLSQRLGWDWIDADTYLESQAGRSIRDIFESEGEAGFRDREVAVLADLTARQQIVVAAGGGAVLRPENRLALERAGLTVWLTASADTIERRIAHDPSSRTRRPPLTRLDSSREIQQLLAQREPLYKQCADLVIETDHRLPEEIVELIAQALASSGIAT